MTLMHLVNGLRWFRRVGFGWMVGWVGVLGHSSWICISKKNAFPKWWRDGDLPW